MNTFDAMRTRKRPAAVSLRANGCVIVEDTKEQEEHVEQAEVLAQQQRAELDRVRRETEEAMQQKMAQQLDALRQSQQQMWAAFNQKMAATIKDIEASICRQLIEMSIRTAEIILARNLPDADMLRGIMQDVLSPISDLQGVRVKVGKGAIELLSGASSLQRSYPGIECIEDPALQPGDVVIESRNGIFDGRLNARLEQLAEALAQPPVDESAEG